jgi:hypothetical protein
MGTRSSTLFHPIWVPQPFFTSKKLHCGGFSGAIVILLGQMRQIQMYGISMSGMKMAIDNASIKSRLVGVSNLSAINANKKNIGTNCSAGNSKRTPARQSETTENIMNKTTPVDSGSDGTMPDMNMRATKTHPHTHKIVASNHCTVKSAINKKSRLLHPSFFYKLKKNV